MNQQEYLTRLAARFPECVTAEGLANFKKLAARENAARRRVVERSANTTASTSADATRARRIAWATTLARLSPVDSFEAADALGVSLKNVSSRMDALERAGLAERVTKTRPIKWAIKLPEAAE